MKALVLGALLLAPPALAQTRLGIHAGGTVASGLVRDSIVEPLTVRSAPGPDVRFTLETRLSPLYQVGVSLATTWAPLREHTPDASRDVVQLVTWQPAVTLRRRLGSAVSLWASAGAIIYRPDRTAGTLFAEGSPIVPVLGLGAGIERRVSRTMAILVDAGYDVHRFTTTTLRDNGFEGERVVHRFGASLGVTRSL